MYVVVPRLTCEGQRGAKGHPETTKKEDKSQKKSMKLGYLLAYAVATLAGRHGKLPVFFFFFFKLLL